MFSSRMARVALTVVSLVCALWIVDPVSAQQAASAAQTKGSVDDHARKFFEAGRAAYDVGNYTEALNHFQQAYELSERPQLLYNIGQCADRLRLDETALAA